MTRANIEEIIKFCYDHSLVILADEVKNKLQNFVQNKTRV